jgi:hypothetical protein
MTGSLAAESERRADMAEKLWDAHPLVVVAGGAVVALAIAVALICPITDLRRSSVMPAGRARAGAAAQLLIAAGANESLIPG